MSNTLKCQTERKSDGIQGSLAEIGTESVTVTAAVETFVNQLRTSFLLNVKMLRENTKLT